MVAQTRCATRSRAKFPWAQLPPETRVNVYQQIANYQSIPEYFDDIDALSIDEIKTHFSLSHVPEPDCPAYPQKIRGLFLINRQTAHEAAYELGQASLVISRALPEWPYIQRRDVINCAFPLEARLKLRNVVLQIPDATPFRKTRLTDRQQPWNWSAHAKFWSQAITPSMDGKSELQEIRIEFDPGSIEKVKRESEQATINRENAKEAKAMEKATEKPRKTTIAKKIETFEYERSGFWWDYDEEDDCGDDSDDYQSDDEEDESSQVEPPTKAVYVFRRSESVEVRLEILQLGRNFKDAEYLRQLQAYMESHGVRE
ncbi:hypothetical protein EJ08DRAFT_213536 [Tothia fuscella]|uniref:Uncharacterized protein n=1 Tax=Tothia fuscella TaxID=1048955 RepID=A0A9P4TXY9_9PEZI|nr:hypothetical protein EJ08DRAFT_213536 [Tothia fuscella]